MKIERINLGGLIREKIEEKGMSQAEFARLIGMARHTWASIAAQLDIPNETIAAALGHGFGNRITAIYIDFDSKKVDEANRKVIDYVVHGIVNKT